MQSVPKSLRLQIAFFGRTNVGKSSFLNLIAGQSVAITSPVAGTTTDIVEKPMELYPIGPVVLIDTAGLNDHTALGALRIAKTKQVFDRADVIVVLTENGCWGLPERSILDEATRRNIKTIIVVNKVDQNPPSTEFLEKLKSLSSEVICVCSSQSANREALLAEFKPAVWRCAPEDFIHSPELLGDLLKPGELAVMIVPIDIQAPKSRLIVPQVHAIRDVLDHNAMVLVVKEDEYPKLIATLNPRPALVVCDSQVVDLMTKYTPEEIPCTTFSVLFSRLKGDMDAFLEGCRAIDTLQEGDRVLVAEACSHHPTCEDIGRVKIPRWLQAKTGKTLNFEFCAGRDFPADLSSFKLVVHCGSCMLNRRETLWRIALAKAAGIPITNYGMAISHCRNVLARIMKPFEQRSNSEMEK